jgi:hypothetical protein
VGLPMPGRIRKQLGSILSRLTLDQDGGL